MRRRRHSAALLAAVVMASVVLLVVTMTGDGSGAALTRESREVRGDPPSSAGVERTTEQTTRTPRTSHNPRTPQTPKTPRTSQTPRTLRTPRTPQTRTTRTPSGDAPLTSAVQNLTRSQPTTADGHSTVLTLRASELKPVNASESSPRRPVAGPRPVTTPAEVGSVSPLSGCPCRRSLPPGARRVSSSCAGFASRRGARQRVVSFSWFGSVKTAYFRGIAANAALLPVHYPGWVMRVYYRDPERRYLPWLCPLVCRFPHLDLCEVAGGDRSGPATEEEEEEVTHGEGALWRFLPLADPSVELFVSRDLDSLIGQRESDAVQEWISSGKTIHVMRDHPLHAVSILAGAWGASNHRNDIYQPLRERLVTVTDTAALALGEDQRRLAEFVYRPALAQGDVLEHDSYFCGVFGPSQPFPRQRDLSTYPHFIGDRVMFRDHERERKTHENWLFYIRKCPPKCRPQRHLDWLWC